MTPTGPGAAPIRRVPVILRQNGMRPVSLDDVIAAVGGLAELGRVPVDEFLDMREFAEEIENGTWGPSHGMIWRRAAEIKEKLRSLPDAHLIYAGGNPEVPHAVALGAYIEEHWAPDFYDLHSGSLAWPTTEQTLNLGDPIGLPLDRMTTAGPAILRIEISYRVGDDQVREFVSEAEQVADVRLAPQGADSRPGVVRSQADVAEIRRAVSHAITTLVDRRPKLTTIHLFIAAPPSACVATGQELRLRNHPPVQTYRHRRRPDGVSETKEAFRLTAHGPAARDIPLTPAQAESAAGLRQDLWSPAIGDVERYADRKRRENDSTDQSHANQRWYDRLPWGRQLQRVHPFPALPSVYRMVKRPATVDPVPFDDDGFGFQRDNRMWRINDRLLLQVTKQFPNPDDARVLVRIFLFHEYLHEVHGITKESYREVGKFPNGLEHADYMCDLYGMLHEVDLESDQSPTLCTDFEQYKNRVAELIDLVLRSFWVFEEPPPLEALEIRRMRRYMNWYWQQVRVRRAESALQLSAVLARKPIVEIAGLATRAEGRRHYGSLRRLDREVGLEMGIVLDSEQLFRIKTGVNTPLDELIRDFRDHNHNGIQEFFRRAFTEAEMTGHVLPREGEIP